MTITEHIAWLGDRIGVMLRLTHPMNSLPIQHNLVTMPTWRTEMSGWGSQVRHPDGTLPKIHLLPSLLDPDVSLPATTALVLGHAPVLARPRFALAVAILSCGSKRGNHQERVVNRGMGRSVLRCGAGGVSELGGGRSEL